MSRIWWIFLIAVLAVGTFLWHGDLNSSGRLLFDNMRNAKTTKPLAEPAKTLAAGMVDDSGSGNSFASQGGGYFQTGRINGGFGNTMPPEMGGMAEDASVASKGEAVYARYCISCHGSNGDGKGKLAQYPEFPAMGAFWSEKYDNYPLGKIFCSIAEGQGNMPAFANKMAAREIWEAVRWVIELQSRRGEGEALENREGEKKQ